MLSLIVIITAVRLAFHQTTNSRKYSRININNFQHFFIKLHKRLSNKSSPNISLACIVFISEINGCDNRSCNTESAND